MNKEFSEDWNVGDKFKDENDGTLGIEESEIYTVKEVDKYHVTALDEDSKTGVSCFLKAYITKIVDK